MKLKQFTKTVAVGSFGATFAFLLASCEGEQAPAAQADKPAAEKPAAEANAAATVPVFLVTVSGKG